MPAGAKGSGVMFEETIAACPTPPAELSKEGDAESHPGVSLCGLTSTCEASSSDLTCLRQSRRLRV